RFELNHELLRHEKLNQRFEFPEELDLEPFTTDGLERLSKAEMAETNPDIEVPPPYTTHPEQYYKYKLVGVVVHTGTTDSGHYYSYIKNRKTNVWSEFNDDVIKPFDIKDLDRECFGGKKSPKDSTSWNSNWDTQENNRSGYVLVYERETLFPREHVKARSFLEDMREDMERRTRREREKNDIKEAVSEEPKKDNEKASKKKEARDDDDIDLEMMAVAVMENKRVEDMNDQEQKEEKKEADIVNSLDVADLDVAAVVAPDIRATHFQNNIDFMRSRQVFNPLFLKFLFEILQVAPLSPRKEYQAKEDVNSCPKAGPFQQIYCFSKVVISKLRIDYNIPACKWFFSYLSERPTLVCEHLLQAHDIVVLRGFSELLVHVFKALKPFEDKNLEKTQKVKVNEGGKEVEKIVDVTYSTRMLNTLIDLILEAPKHWLRFTHFFHVFRDFAEMGPLERRFLVRKQLIEKLGDLYLGTASPFTKGNPNKQYMHVGARIYPPKLYPIVQTLSLLICSCHTPATKQRSQNTEQQKKGSENSKRKGPKFPKTALVHTNANGQEDLLVMSSQDEKIRETKEFCARMVTQAQNSRETLDALNNIICHWCFEDASYTSEIVFIILDGIDRSNADSVVTLLLIMERFISVEDSLQQERMNKLHGKDPSVLRSISVCRTHHQLFAFNCIRYLVEIMERNETYRRFMLKKRNEWKWWDGWLQNYVNSQPRSQANAATSSAANDAEKKKFYEKYLQVVGLNNKDTKGFKQGQTPQSNSRR
ncbi:Ubiquitin carboxyl-terminal hydrolase family protein, partial [Reticulomyxa filosa]